MQSFPDYERKIEESALALCNAIISAPNDGSSSLLSRTNAKNAHKNNALGLFFFI